MLRYITEFTDYEKDFFWLTCDKPTTLCRVAVVLCSKDDNIILSERYSKPHDDEHAEVTALRYIVDELGSKPLIISDESAVLDVMIRLNNSPCFNCQDLLFDLLLQIKAMAPKVHFRLILFFSNLYHKSDKGIEKFCKWILNLVMEDVVVILCPLIVYKMVPKPDGISGSEVHDMVELGRDCIDDFRDILSEIESYQGSFSIWTSHKFFREKYQVYMRLFGWENPHFFSIRPKSVPYQLSKLFIDNSFFKTKATMNDITLGNARKRPAQSHQYPQSSKPANASTMANVSAINLAILPVVSTAPCAKKAKHSNEYQINNCIIT